ncbi:hypothetical protein [Salipiger sp. PrR003]|uniref:hypothetical protein n=1 Tax=Salipiger sp. PrR003 TaxID=2706776 RepID=UPI0013DAF562|nr:hypothetical protein [Salipiger sp. PrR003]NDV52814.1 hypothetical protein [Salipiger sp. PrR003]
MTSNIEKFIQSAAPYGLWQALLGCLPGDSDILLGEDSNAAKMLESVLDDVERNGLNPQSIGYPSTEVVSSYPGLTALLRKKLLSGVVLAATATRSARTAKTAERDLDDMGMAAGILCIVGNFDEMEGVLPQVYPEVPNKVTRRMRSLPSPPAVRILGGSAVIDMKRRAASQFGTFLADMIETAVADVLSGAHTQTPLYRLPNTEIAHLPEELATLEEDDVDRINAIAAYCGNRIDADGISLNRAFAAAPYRKTLAQNLSQRIFRNLEAALTSYGARVEGDNITLAMPTGSDFGPLLYRLFGDPAFHLEGLLCQELFQSVSIALPELPARAPETFLLPPSQALMAEFFMSFGGADACICLWDTESEIPERYLEECGEVHSVVPANPASVHKALREISTLFPADAFGTID